MDNYEYYADLNRKDILKGITPGNKVWLSANNMNTNRPAKKLSERWFCPFLITEKIGSHAFKLQLPDQRSSAHPVFHASILKPYSSDPNSPSHQPPPEPVEIDGQELFLRVKFSLKQVIPL